MDDAPAIIDGAILPVSPMNPIRAFGAFHDEKFEAAPAAGDIERALFGVDGSAIPPRRFDIPAEEEDAPGGGVDVPKGIRGPLLLWLPLLPKDMGVCCWKED